MPWNVQNEGQRSSIGLRVISPSRIAATICSARVGRGVEGVVEIVVVEQVVAVQVEAGQRPVRLGGAGDPAGTVAVGARQGLVEAAERPPPPQSLEGQRVELGLELALLLSLAPAVTVRETL